jgi:hypothetical protein
MLALTSSRSKPRERSHRDYYATAKRVVIGTKDDM